MRDSYTVISSMDDLDSLLKQSDQRAVFLFKHSTVCPISGHAEAEYHRYASSVESDVTCGFLDLRAHRDISDAIEQRLGIVHQSPQAILVVNGKPVWRASHHDITTDALAAAVAENR